MTKKCDVTKQELMRINDKFGQVDPRTVWRENESPDAPIHNRFEWDDGRASDLYRDEQARAIIRTVKIQVSPIESAPAFVNVVCETGTTYMPTRDVVEIPEIWEQVIADAVRDLRGIHKRLDSLLALEDMPDKSKARVKEISRHLRRASEDSGDRPTT